MAIIYSYPLNTPKPADLLIGTIIHDENDDNSPKNNPTVSFTVQSLLDLIAGGGAAQNLQQVTNLGATTTNIITITSDIKVAGRYYDSSDQPGANWSNFISNKWWHSMDKQYKLRSYKCRFNNACSFFCS